MQATNTKRVFHWLALSSSWIQKSTCKDTGSYVLFTEIDHLSILQASSLLYGKMVVIITGFTKVPKDHGG